MSTKHTIAAEKFLQNSEKVTRHDQTFWSVRVKRDAQSQELPEWEELREAASQIKKHTITHLAEHLEKFEKMPLKTVLLFIGQKMRMNIMRLSWTFCISIKSRKW